MPTPIQIHEERWGRYSDLECSNQIIENYLVRMIRPEMKHGTSWLIVLLVFVRWRVVLFFNISREKMHQFGISLIHYANTCIRNAAEKIEPKLIRSVWLCWPKHNGNLCRSKSLRSRGNMQKRSMHVLLILKKHMIAFLETSFGRCCCSMALMAN